MSDLKQQLVKLGYENTSLRKHLRPVLSKIDKVGVSFPTSLMSSFNSLIEKAEEVQDTLPRVQVSYTDPARDRPKKNQGNHEGWPYYLLVVSDPKTGEELRFSAVAVDPYFPQYEESPYEGGLYVLKGNKWEITNLGKAQRMIQDLENRGMKTSSLRESLIKLGASHRELREHIRPVLDHIKTAQDAEMQRVYDAVNEAERASSIDGMLEAFMSSYRTDSFDVANDILLRYSDKYKKKFKRTFGDLI